jgi:hypothetical protein
VEGKKRGEVRARQKKREEVKKLSPCFFLHQTAAPCRGAPFSRDGKMTSKQRARVDAALAAQDVRV